LPGDAGAVPSAHGLLCDNAPACQGLGHAQSGLADIQAGIEAATLSI